MNIILTTNLSDEPLDAEHQFVTIGPNCWGIGDSAEKAHKNAKANGPRNYRGPFITRVAPKDGFGVDPVDGSVWYSGKHDAKECKFCTVGKGIRISTTPKPVIR